jgi:hypothetical protein
MDSDSRIEKKIDTVINLLVGILGSVMATAALFVGEGYSSDKSSHLSVFLAALAFFATTFFVKRMLRHI